MKQGQVIEVKLWGTTIGFLGYAPNQTQFATFEYDKTFAQTSIQISPLVMKHPPLLHTFETISQRSFHGLAGIFADSLPDKFGNQLIDQFMADKNILPNEVTALDRLLYVGNRGMGALEYHPLVDEKETVGIALDVHTLSELSNLLLTQKEIFSQKLHSARNRQDALNIIRVGSSAGGARSKALVAIDENGILYDGTIDQGVQCRYYLLKFDSAANQDKDTKDPKGMTKVEYIYSIIARACGRELPETSFIEKNGDIHFLIQRSDREIVVQNDKKIVRKKHYASWAGLSHADREVTGAYSYEQLILSARALGVGEHQIKELFRRAIFNLVGRNQDDHTKNFGFLMDRTGKWSLAPAFDMTYAYDPSGKWTRVHQIRFNGKQDDFTMNDVIVFGKKCNLSEKEVKEVVAKTIDAFATFETLAHEYAVADALKKTVSSNLRLKFL